LGQTIILDSLDDIDQITGVGRFEQISVGTLKVGSVNTYWAG
jgi:hypothetical protein